MRVSILLLFSIFVLSNLSSNAQFVFIGNGAWSNPANWQGGIKPGTSLGAGGTIIIQGTATTSTSLPYDFLFNYGTVTVAPGGALTINTETQFSNNGSFVVEGTYTNKTLWENHIGATFNVKGMVKNQVSAAGFTSGFTNRGTVTIENGGTFRNESGSYTNNSMFMFTSAGAGNLVINGGGTFLNLTRAYFLGNITNNGTIINSAKLNGDAVITGNLVNQGELAPGTSPGTFTINGNYTAEVSSVHTFEVQGTTASSYDRLLVSGDVNLGGTLNVSLINGFFPATAHDLTIMTGTINGSFSAVNIPPSYSLIYNSNSVVLRFSTALPVLFKSIDAKRDGNEVYIQWQVAEEHDLANYEVQASIDGANFVPRKTILPNGNEKYSYKDQVASNRKMFYRIKALDYDGKFRFSPMVVVSDGLGNIPLKAFPNIARNQVTVQHSKAEKLNMITITSSEGKVLDRVVAVEGSQQTSLDISHLPTGVYFISFTNNSNVERGVKLIKN